MPVNDSISFIENVAKWSLLFIITFLKHKACMNVLGYIK